MGERATHLFWFVPAFFPIYWFARRPPMPFGRYLVGFDAEDRLFYERGSR